MLGVGAHRGVVSGEAKARMPVCGRLDAPVGLHLPHVLLVKAAVLLPLLPPASWNRYNSFVLAARKSCSKYAANGWDRLMHPDHFIYNTSSALQS